ncbi:MAG: TVP38/TMEM64 family protein [Syntrophales bacterium]|nr:TVP38/TMEM64 family protein [Syntrophales bacterium]MDD5233344.1 TVP38/TMEM64 family protein [Syntrophales bacterium]MDD5531560.1 TVP38/TMEM64 family protein [Syntrophales bacterium]
MPKTPLRIAALIIAVAAAVYLLYYFNLYIYFVDRKKLVYFLTSFGPYSIVVFILLQIMQVLVAPVPGEVTGLIGGYLYGPVLGTIYSTIGLSIGSWIAFILARTFGLPFVERAVNAGIIQKYDHFMKHQGIIVSFVLFLIPGFPKDALCYIMGLSHMPLGTFLIISTAGRLFGTILLSISGSCVRNEQNAAFFILMGISAIIFLIGYFYREKILAAVRGLKSEK